MPSPSDGWHACSRRCQLALDLTIRGTGYTYTPCTLWETAMRLVFFWFIRCFHSCCFHGNILISKVTLRLLPCLCWQKGDRPDNDLRWAMQHPDKKNLPERADVSWVRNKVGKDSAQPPDVLNGGERGQEQVREAKKQKEEIEDPSQDQPWAKRLRTCIIFRSRLVAWDCR